jgi:hypothetical protein
MKKEELEKLIAENKAMKEQAIANANAYEGAIQAFTLVLNSLPAEEVKPTEEIASEDGTK